jgi:ribulose-phosphate 3-epimerase
MSIIIPSVTAPDAQAYREEMARVVPFAKRVHLDFSDGLFSPVKLINLVHAYWPEGMAADLHLMFKNPAEQLETAISLKPELVIIQAEADGDLVAILRELRAVGIRGGVALLQATEPHAAHDLISESDHVLIFSGTLGQFGGHADLTLLQKVSQIRAINPHVEISWDGGVNIENAAQITLGGVDVLVAGGAIHKAPDASEAYKQLIDITANVSA